MTIPDFQSVMLPLLRMVSVYPVLKVTQAVDELAQNMGLTDIEIAELLASGSQTRWGSRVAWAATHLVQAGLMQRPSRGFIQVTDLGMSVLARPPEKITIKFLSQYPSYVQFKFGNKKAKIDTGSTELHDAMAEDAEISPSELLESTYIQFRTLLAQEVLSITKQVPPTFFERLVVQLLVAMGYGGSFRDAAQAIGKTGDGGIDGIIKEDRLGLDFVAVQAKRWEHSVGREVVQAFAGSLMGHGASKGVLISTSSFTSGAKDYAQKLSSNKIVLIDGEQLAELMLDFGIGVTEVTTYRIQRVDSDYFDSA
jgi:restriction system protein